MYQKCHFQASSVKTFQACSSEPLLCSWGLVGKTLKETREVQLRSVPAFRAPPRSPDWCVSRQ